MKPATGKPVIKDCQSEAVPPENNVNEFGSLQGDSDSETSNTEPEEMGIQC